MTSMTEIRYVEDSRELAEAIGRLLIVGFEGADFAEVEELVTRVRPAGLIFFKRNFPEAGGPRALRELIDSVQALAESQLGRRLLVAIDHEGGLVQRLPAPYAQLPAAAEIPDPAAAAESAGRGARELAATGFNFNLAPVLDVASPMGGFMGSRSFSDDPEQVLACGRAQLAAFHQAGVLGAGKHFPGLGSATVDPHHELPTLENDRRRLMEVDLVPFRGLITPAAEAETPGEAGAEFPASADGQADRPARPLLAVMTTHAFFPALDPERPATLSEEIVNFLKSEMGFTGALLTDDLEMGAVIKNYPLGEAAAEAVRAGHDLALICRRREYISECRKALGEALRSGRISESRLAEAHERSGLLARRLAYIRPGRDLLDQWFETLAAGSGS